jgi:hypothetical protein
LSLHRDVNTIPTADTLLVGNVSQGSEASPTLSQASADEPVLLLQTTAQGVKLIVSPRRSLIELVVRWKAALLHSPHETVNVAQGWPELISHPLGLPCLELLTGHGASLLCPSPLTR